MSAEIPVALVPILGGLLAAALAPTLRRWLLVALPCVTFVWLLALEPGTGGRIAVFGFELETMRVDRLSLAFGYIFCIAAFLSTVFSWHAMDGPEQPASMVYAGSAIGAVFAGDLVTLFMYWELSALASVLVIWSARGRKAERAGMRYIVIQLASGMLLAAGAAIQYAETGALHFGAMDLGQPGALMLLLAFGIKAAFPLLHNWLPDSYPEASATGTVWLSAFTTKLSIYALARAFPGTEELIWIGTAMAAFPIFYAVIENDLRRVLAYSLNNQLGFMVVGIGIGTQLALNGAVAHAFAHILYKGLLFMSMGAVLYRAGTVKASELGGLYKSMPLTAVFCIVGAASISAFPLFSGFVAKSLIMSSAAHQGLVVVWLILLFASAGVFHHAGIKVPYFAFFAHDSGIRCKEAPPHMLVAMGVSAALCIGIGVFPQPLYAILPYPVDYVPYTASHVLSQLQLLVFSALAFAVLMRTGVYPPELPSVNLDSDWIYRRLLADAARGAVRAHRAVTRRAIEITRALLHALLALVARLRAPDGLLARTGSTAAMGGWVMLVLIAHLMLYHLF